MGRDPAGRGERDGAAGGPARAGCLAQSPGAGFSIGPRAARRRPAGALDLHATQSHSRRRRAAPSHRALRPYMSYILDALRKADAQRERDPARGIHAQPVQASPLERPEGRQPRLWLGGAAAIVAGLLAVAAWQLAGPAVPPVAVPTASPVAYSP